jgi:hypothetical protein
MLASSVSGQAYLAVNASDPLKRPDATAQLVCFTGKDGQAEPGQRIAAVAIQPEGGAKRLLRLILPLGTQLPPAASRYV